MKVAGRDHRRNERKQFTNVPENVKEPCGWRLPYAMEQDVDKPLFIIRPERGSVEPIPMIMSLSDTFENGLSIQTWITPNQN